MGEEAAAAVTAAATYSAPHLLLICFPGQGHVNPMLRLAKRFAAKGLLVTFSSTSYVGGKIVASSGVEAGGDGVPLGRGRIRFELLDDRFDGKELDDLMRHRETTGPPAFAELLRRQEAAGWPVTCVVGNPFLSWAIDVAHDAGIPVGTEPRIDGDHRRQGAIMRELIEEFGSTTSSKSKASNSKSVCKPSVVGPSCPPPSST